MKQVWRSVRFACKRLVAWTLRLLFPSTLFERFGLAKGLTQVDPTCLMDVEEKEFPRPTSYGNFLHETFFDLQTVTFPSEGIYELSDAIATRSGGVLDQKGRLVQTYLPVENGLPAKQHPVFFYRKKRNNPKIYQTKKRVATLCSPWQGAFYHWIYEVLPRLTLLEKAGARYDELFVEQHFSFQKESLRLLGIPPETIINAKEFDAVSANELLVTSIPGRGGPVPKWALQALQERFSPLLPKLPRHKLYISRRDAKVRRIVNEDELIALLKKLGYEVIEMTKHSLLEQMALFQSADSIITPHGAALSHLVFCKPETRVLEFFSHEYVNPCYFVISEQLQLRYAHLFGKKRANKKGGSLSTDPDIDLDFNKVEAFVKQNYS